MAKRQVTHDFAIGARGMHALQNYDRDEPVYDGNAYTYGSTHHAGTGTLQLDSCHMTAPIASGGRPEYHVTQLDSYGMTGNRRTFIEGATALRNSRESASSHRIRFIATANARASGHLDEDNPAHTADVQQAEGSNLREYSTSQDVYQEPSAAGHQSVGGDGYDASQGGDGKRTARLDYLYDRDDHDEQDEQDENQVSVAFNATEEPRESLAASSKPDLTSTFANQSQDRSNHPRDSQSPQPSTQPLKKSGLAEDQSGQGTTEPAYPEGSKGVRRRSGRIKR